MSAIAQENVQEKSKHSAILPYLAVTLALATPVLQAVLRPLWELFPEPLNRFMSLTIFWIVSALVLFYSVRIEGVPLATFGIKKNTRSLRYRLIEMILVLIFGLFVLIGLILFSTYLREALGIPLSNTIDLAKVPPFWVTFPAWLTAAFCEELLFRSYPIEYLGMLTGNRWLAAGISCVCFVVFHIFGWDWLHLVSIVLPAALIATGLYLWRRSFWLVIVLHGLLDITILFLPLIAPYLAKS